MCNYLDKYWNPLKLWVSGKVHRVQDCAWPSIANARLHHEQRGLRLICRITSYEISPSLVFRYLVYAYGRCGWSRRIHELAFFNSAIFIEVRSIPSL